jgi:hypothetical protein
LSSAPRSVPPSTVPAADSTTSGEGVEQRPPLPGVARDPQPAASLPPQRPSPAEDITPTSPSNNRHSNDGGDRTTITPSICCDVDWNSHHRGGAKRSHHSHRIGFPPTANAAGGRTPIRPGVRTSCLTGRRVSVVVDRRHAPCPSRLRGTRRRVRGFSSERYRPNAMATIELTPKGDP